MSNLVKTEQKKLTEYIDYNYSGETAKKVKGLALKIFNDPKLAICSQGSINEAIKTVLSTDLSLLKEAKHFYLIPFKNKKTSITSLQLILTANAYRAMYYKVGIVFNGGTVREQDEFIMGWDGFNNTIKSYQQADEQERGKLTGAFATAKDINTGAIFTMYMTKAQLDKRRALAKSPQFWDAWEDEMYLKTVIKALAKTLPFVSANISTAIGRDDKEYGERKDDYVEVEVEQPDAFAEDTKKAEDDEAPM